MTTIQTIAVISPFVSAILTAFLTFKFTSRSKALDILYHNRVPAFKEIATISYRLKIFAKEGLHIFRQMNFPLFIMSH